MLKKITEEETREMMKENPEEQVAIFNENDKQWYDIRGLSMEKVGSELMKMAERGSFKEQK